MSNQAHVILRGTLLQAPKTDKTSSGSPWLKLSVAVRTTKQKEGAKYPESDFYNVNVFGKYAETLAPSLKMKSRVLVIGDMYMGEPYKNRDGEMRISPVVTATTVEVIGDGNRNNNQSNNDEDEPF